MTKTIRWGVLGASKFARDFMARAIHAANNASLTAIATSDPAKAEPFSDFAPGLTVYTSYDDLLASDQVDAVYLPLPNHLHVEWVLKALEAGKHVLCEKPIALSAPEIDQIIAKRDATGLLAAEAFMIVHHPQWQRARHLISDGAIGKLVHVEGQFTYNNPSETNIRNRPETGGGGIPDIGVYTYGSTRFVTAQEPLEITHADITFENKVDVIARVSARFPDFSAHWLNSMRMFPLQDMTFHGDLGLLRLTAPFNPGVFGEARIELHQPNMATQIERFPSANHYVLQVEAFGRAVRGEEQFAWPLEQAKGTQSMIDAVFAKAASG